jgi:putative ABC transport system permease protein
MERLTNTHIDYIIKDLTYRGIILDGFRDEVIDHICSSVEQRMAGGTRFIDAYDSVLRQFGDTHGLHNTQKQILIADNKTTKLMLRNYFTIAFRNLSKHKFFTAINAAGLAIGIASCLVIMLYVINELSFDRHFGHAERVYRLDSEIEFNGNHHSLAVAPAPAADAMLNDFPEVEASVHFRTLGSRLIRAEKSTENIKEDRIACVSEGIFKVFPLDLIAGNQATALKDPQSLILSQSTAEKYFADANPIGQTLILENREMYKVSGVFPDLPRNTHFHFDVLLSMEGHEESKNNMWLSNNFNTYILLREGSSPNELSMKFPAMIETYLGPQVTAVFGPDFTLEKYYSAGNKFVFSLMPVTRIHLHSDLKGEMGVNSDITYVYLFSAVALFILGIATINFMNLSTARSANRAKEVGVRKVLGSLRSHLVRQFLTESILLSVFSFILALGITVIAIPYFNVLAGVEISIPFAQPRFIFLMFLAALFIGVLAGLYPSLFLSAFKPVNVLKGKLSLGMKSGAVRSGLVVFQFVISIFLIVATITVQKQLSYIQNKKLGFTKDQVVVLHDTHVLGSQTEAFKQRLLASPSITHASTSAFLPIAGWGRHDTSFWPEGMQASQENLTSMQYWTVDHDYIETLGMNVVAGRNFSPEFPSDSSAVIINEAAARKFGFENPLGQRIVTFDFSSGVIDASKTLTYTIVGVVENFHFESLRQNITPLCLQLGSSTAHMSFRFQSADTQDVIALLETNWKSMAPGQPFQYSFLDDAFGKMYASEQRLGSIFGIFAVLAIIIACLGLFALTAFTAEQRTKEIGIRKVLGASIGSIVVLLSKEFGKLILIAFVLSLPISWFAVDWWLQHYTFKAEVGVTIYLLSGVAAFVVAWLTMGYQSVKAAICNPVDSLRSE